MPRRTLAIVAASLAAVAVVVLLVVLAPRPPAEPPITFAEQAPPAPLAQEPSGVGITAAIDAAWAQRVAAATGIPQRAVLAYAGAARVANDIKPGCGIGWNTIAGIGLVESDHGRHDGSALDENGTATPPILGVVLDGGDTANIPDTDGGEFDGDDRYDRAMGPLQLIPDSWRNWAYDGNADGMLDPQNIDDAAVAAANYLCRASDSDMATPQGWRAGITAYNVGTEYLQNVAAAAQRYFDEAG